MTEVWTVEFFGGPKDGEVVNLPVKAHNLRVALGPHLSLYAFQSDSVLLPLSRDLPISWAGHYGRALWREPNS